MSVSLQMLKFPFAFMACLCMSNCWSSAWVTGWKIIMVITIVVVDYSLLPRMPSSGYHGSIFCGQVDLESKETPHQANDLVVVMRGGASWEFSMEYGSWLPDTHHERETSAM